MYLGLGELCCLDAPLDWPSPAFLFAGKLFARFQKHLDNWKKRKYNKTGLIPVSDNASKALTCNKFVSLILTQSCHQNFSVQKILL
jgi:hypothetical protein